jgi:hypothetical protein
VRHWFVDRLTPGQLDALTEICAAALTALDSSPSAPRDDHTHIADGGIPA